MKTGNENKVMKRTSTRDATSLQLHLGHKGMHPLSRGHHPRQAPIRRRPCTSADSFCRCLVIPALIQCSQDGSYHAPCWWHCQLSHRARMSAWTLQRVVLHHGPSSIPLTQTLTLRGLDQNCPSWGKSQDWGHHNSRARRVTEAETIFHPTMRDEKEDGNWWY